MKKDDPSDHLFSFRGELDTVIIKHYLAFIILTI